MFKLQLIWNCRFFRFQGPKARVSHSSVSAEDAPGEQGDTQRRVGLEAWPRKPLQK